MESDTQDAKPLDVNDPRNRLRAEAVWASWQPFLTSRGYVLRPRFRADWKPSWKEGADISFMKRPEDAYRMRHASILDAIRRSDSQQLVLKRVETSTKEITLMTRLTSLLSKSKHQGHCTPLLDVVLLPDTDEIAVIAVPKLLPFGNPPFETMGEIFHFMRQITQGLAILHENNIVHRDIHPDNLMMDADNMFPKGSWTIRGEQILYLPRDPLNPRGRLLPAPHISRSLATPTYYFIDFGLAEEFKPGEERLDFGTIGHQDVVVPEIRAGQAYDPFPVDVLSLGDLIKKEILATDQEWDKKPLVEEWVSRLMDIKPKNRPTATQAVVELDEIIRSIPESDMRRPFTTKRPWRSIAMLKYESSAILAGQNTLYQELYSGLVEKPTTSDNSTWTRWVNVFKNVLSS